MRCNLYWGSHGCDRPAGHEGPHICGIYDPDGLCSQWENGYVRYYRYVEDGLIELSEPYEVESYT